MDLRTRLNLKPMSKIINLPSNGKFGNPTSVSVRPFNVRDEKIMLSLDKNDAEITLINLCKTLVAEQEFDPAKCIDIDVISILLAAKALTYGDNMTAHVECYSCEYQQNASLILDDLAWKNTEFETEFKFTLPNSKLTIMYRILTYGEVAQVINSSKQENKLLYKKVDPDELNIKKAMAMITAVYDQAGKELELSYPEKYELVSEILTKADMDAWADDVEERVPSNTFEFEHTCEKCQHKGSYKLLVDYNFFFSKIKEVPSIPLIK